MADIFLLIEKRHSVRNFSSYDLTDAERDSIHQFFRKLPKIFEGSAIEWLLKTPATPGSGKLFAMLPVQAPENLVEYGFEGEALVLKLTEWGFGTCWMAVGRAVEKGSPAVIVFGKEGGGTVYSRASRFFVRGGKRKPLEERLSPGSHKPSLEQERIIAAMRLAPSAVNRQPWQFTLKSGQSIFVKKLPGNPVWSYLDLGIVLLHGFMAARALFKNADVACLDKDNFVLNF